MNKMNDHKNKRIRISASHLAAFVLLYGINILLFFALRGYFFLLTWFLLTLLVPCSFYMAWRLADFVEGKIAITHKAVRPEESVCVVVSVTNTSFLCALHSTWKLLVGNSFFQTCDEQKLLLSIPPRGTKQFPMTVSVTDLGRIAFTCTEYVLADLLGIFLIHAKCSAEDYLFVLPQGEEMTPRPLPEAYAGAAELTESTRKGSDHSEVSDIRTYVPGDRPRDIHWKLSARQRELMVKERVSLSGSEHVLLLDLPADKTKTLRLLTESYLSIIGMFEMRMTIRLLVWNQRLFTFDAYSCGDIAELDSAFCELFSLDLASRSSDRLHTYMSNCYPQLPEYMCLSEQDNTIQMEICTNG